MVAVKNISTGPRGVYLDGIMKMVEPGKIAESDDDFEPEWFEEVEAKKTAAKAKPVAADKE